MAFGSEIAACRFPDDSSTTAGLLPDPSALPPLQGGSQETDLHQIPINTPGQTPLVAFVSKGETRGPALRLSLKEEKCMDVGRSHPHFFSLSMQQLTNSFIFSFARHVGS